MSVTFKLNAAVIGVSLASLMFGAVVLFQYQNKTKAEIYQNTKSDLISDSIEKIESKKRVGITNALSIANDSRIKKALQTNNRKYAIESLSEISKLMKTNTEFQNIKIHLHTRDNRSFLRNWKLDHYGDDLSSFRKAVVYTNRMNKPVVTFEAGRAGLLLRAIVPINDKDTKHLGSLEFIQGLNSVAKEFSTRKTGFLLLMNQDLIKTISTGKDFSFKENKKFKNYIISQNFIDEDFFNDVKTINMKKLLKDGYLLSSKYFYTYATITDFENKNLGITLLAKPLSVVNNSINHALTLIYMSLLGILFMIALISFIVMLAIKKLVTVPLGIFEKSLLEFFAFLQSKQDHISEIEIYTNDEFGTMAKSLRQNIEYSTKLHREIHELNTNLEKIVEEKTKKVTTLLNNAGQGFLTFNTDFIVDDEYSKECERLISSNIASQDISTLLFHKKEDIELFKTTLIHALQETSSIKRNAYLSLIPSIIILNKKALQLEYKILEDSKFMLVITNITSQKKLEKKIKQEQNIMKMIVSIISETETFYETKKEYINFIDNFKYRIDRSKTPLYNTNNVYRTIHTFKGAFSQLYMQDVVNFLHELESEISDLQKEMNHTNNDLIELLQNTDFHTSLEKSLNTLRNVLGDEFLETDSYLKVDLSDITDLQGKIEKILDGHEKNIPECVDVLSQIQHLASQKLTTLLNPYVAATQQLASRLKKEIYPLDIIGDSDILVQEKYKPFIKSLIHVFRNSIDHGIEFPEDRLYKNKDEMGTIFCSFKAENDKLSITISDDGSGIDVDKIKEKLTNKGINTSNLSNEEVYEYIFDDNFSTRDIISDISGRGVGMSAVKGEIEKLEGEIKINSQKDVGTTFEFVVPFLEN